MSWRNRAFKFVPESVTAAIKYLLQRYLGQYIDKKLTRDQIDIKFLKGEGSMQNVRLSAESLNSKLADKQNWPLEFVDGYIRKVQVQVPYSRIFTDPVVIVVTGLQFILQPKQRDDCAQSMFESMWNSMTSSLDLAEEYENFDKSTILEPIQSVEKFATVIESILGKAQFQFLDTTIIIEHVPKDSQNGVGIVINIDTLSYKFESAKESTKDETVNLSKEEAKKAYLEQSYSTHTVMFEGVSLSTIEFPSNLRTFSRNVHDGCVDDDDDDDDDNNDNERCDSLNTILEHTTLDEDSDDNSSVYQEATDEHNRHIILFGKFLESVDVYFRLKRAEDLEGPKVLIEVNFGSLLLFLSPRQVYVLLEFVNGLNTPDLDDHSNVRKLTNKPMSTQDYQRIEQDLQQQLNPFCGFTLGTGFRGHGWSSAPLDECCTEESFLPMRNDVGEMYDDTVSAASSSVESSICSSITSCYSECTGRTRRRLNKIDTDPTAEISRFDIGLESLAIILLHEDVVVESLTNDGLVASSVKQMQQIAGNFFAKTCNATVTNKDRNFQCIGNIFDKACEKNHLRLITSSIHVEGDQKKNVTTLSITGFMEVKRLQLLECLYQTNMWEHVNLLIFNYPIQSDVPATANKSSLKLNFKHIQKCSKGANSSNVGPKTDLVFHLDKCIAEIDITIIDRISALLYPQEICVVKNKNHNPWTAESAADEENKTDSRTDFKIVSPLVNLKLKFPKPDFRPPHDMNRTPWWKRNIRPDYLSIILNNMTLQLTLQNSQIYTDYTIQSRSVDVSYYENEDCPPIPIAKAGFDEKYATSMQDVLLHCRLNVRVFRSKRFDLSATTQTNQVPMATSTAGLFENDKQPVGPFSAKKVVHESEMPHFKSHTGGQEELLIPGEKHEINEFIKLATSSSRIQLDAFLPRISMQLLSKHTYELIYNRINNDLLLWKSSAPAPLKSTYDNLGNFNNLDESDEIYSLCISGIPPCESESDSDDGEDSCPYYSTYTPRSRTAIETKIENYMTLNLQIGHGLLCLHTPVRDGTSNNVIPEQHGEFLISVEDANLFMVNSYMGNPDLSFLCLQVHNGQLYHCDMLSTSRINPPIKDIGTAPEKHLHPTIYKSEAGLLVDCKQLGGNRELLTLAVKIQGNHESHHIKNVAIAVGLNKVTLRHRMCQEPNSWISQLLDFFNVKDYPIPGYQARDILTEMYFTFWESSIDYRPKYLPLRSVITLGSFQISSHLCADVNSSTLRFIAEECGLYLSDKCRTRNNVPYSGVIDLKRDYINVIELGLFDISLKTTDKRNCDNSPHIDLRASNNMINIRTCADSGRALTQLLKYIANYGDLTSPEDTISIGSNYSSPRHHIEHELINVEAQEFNVLSRNQQELVSDLISDALADVDANGTNPGIVSRENPALYSYNGAKLFYFPDENQTVQTDDAPLPQVTSDLGSLQYYPKSELEDGFCFINEECGYNVPKRGQADIKWLNHEPVRLVDNHFTIPEERSDPLKAPKSFPIPVMNYTLCEMSIIWQMFGGSDFDNEKNDDGKRRIGSNDGGKRNVTFANVQTGSSNSGGGGQNSKNKRSWRINGGSNRNHDILMEIQLNKIRFQHEVYPDTSKKVSRIVLIVTDFEVRDRMQSSQINKFLCQYTSQARPKQSNANMIVIKAVNVRPEPKLNAFECCLKISLLPLRFNIDQDALLFLIAFFNEIGGSSKEDEVPIISSKHNTPVHHPPVMTLGEDNDENLKEQAHKIVDENLLILLEENKSSLDENDDEMPSTTANPSEDSPVFFRNVVFSPDVPIRLDYHGKRVDLTHGPLPGLLMGLGQLNYSELTLKRICHRHGLLGFQKLLMFLFQEWLNDIKKNQLPRLLGGVGPMYSFVQLFQGIRDLFWLPYEQYKKDGRILRGLHRGANSFTTSTAMAALELTTRLIHLIQITAETAFDMLTPGPSVTINPKTKKRRKRYNRPTDIRQGVTNAYKLVKEGIEETADNILQVASHEHEQKGYSGAVGGVIRQIPPTIIKPIIIATEATNNVLGGMRCQLVPDARKEAQEKWRIDDVNM